MSLYFFFIKVWQHFLFYSYFFRFFLSFFCLVKIFFCVLFCLMLVIMAHLPILICFCQGSGAIVEQNVWTIHNQTRFPVMKYSWLALLTKLTPLVRRRKVRSLLWRKAAWEWKEVELINKSPPNQVCFCRSELVYIEDLELLAWISVIF